MSLSVLVVAEVNVELEVGALVVVFTVVGVSVDTVVGSTVVLLIVVCSVQIHSEIKCQERFSQSKDCWYHLEREWDTHCP